MVSSFNTQSHNLLLRDFRVDASLRLGNIYFPLWQIDKWHRVLSHLTVCQFWSWSLRWTHSLRSWIKFQVLNMVNETIVWTVMPTAAPPPLTHSSWEFPMSSSIFPSLAVTIWWPPIDNSNRYICDDSDPTWNSIFLFISSEIFVLVFLGILVSLPVSQLYHLRRFSSESH